MELSVIGLVSPQSLTDLSLASNIVIPRSMLSGIRHVYSISLNNSRSFGCHRSSMARVFSASCEIMSIPQDFPFFHRLRSARSS